MAIKLSKEQQKYMAVGVVATGVFLFLYWKVFWSPIAAKIEDTRAKIEELDGKIARAKAQAARLPQLEKELAVLAEQAIEAEKRLPKTKSTPDILVTVSQLALKNRVVIASFSPGAQSQKQYFTELNYPVAARGSFHAIGKFLAALALEERIFNVMNVQFTGGAGDLTVSFTLVSYQYKG